MPFFASFFLSFYHSYFPQALLLFGHMSINMYITYEGVGGAKESHWASILRSGNLERGVSILVIAHNSSKKIGDGPINMVPSKTKL